MIGVLPPGNRKVGDVEMYDDAHYFTLTGKLLSDVSHNVEPRQDELNLLHARFLGGNQNSALPNQSASSGRRRKVNQATNDLVELQKQLQLAELSSEDMEIIRDLQAGRRGEIYRLLFDGDWEGAGCLSKFGPYKTMSEADLGMCTFLAKLVNGKGTRVGAIFKGSGLMRDKVNDHPTYLAMTIKKAIDGRSWKPSKPSKTEKGRR